MSTASVSAPTLLTAEQFAERPDPGYPEELVKEGSCPWPFPSRVMAKFAGKANRIFGNHAEDHDLGQVLSNDSGVISARP